MTLARRLLVISFAYLAACLAAEASFATAVLISEGLLREMTYPILLSLADPLRFGFVLICGATVLPVIAVVTVAEMFNLRSAWAYAIAGAVVGFVSYLAVVPFEHASVVAAHAPSIVEPNRNSIIIAGIVAGVVYWSIAGRTAGVWRQVGSAEFAR